MKRWRESWTERERVCIKEKQPSVWVSSKQLVEGMQDVCTKTDKMGDDRKQISSCFFPTLWARQAGSPCAVMPPQLPDAAVLLCLCVCGSQKNDTLSPTHPETHTDLHYHHFMFMSSECLYVLYNVQSLCLQCFSFSTFLALFQKLETFVLRFRCLVLDFMSEENHTDLQSCYESESFQRISSFSSFSPAKFLICF